MADVKIYTTLICPYCVAAKRFFKAKGIEYEEIDVTGDHDKRMWLMKTSGQRTVPQIFIHDRPYGGYTDVAQLDREGRLDDILSGAAGS